jgi:hypothetical protein
MALLLIDLGFVTFADTSTSLSSWLSYVGIKSPFIAFAAGLTAGHLFPMRVEVCDKCGEKAE